MSIALLLACHRPGPAPAPAHDRDGDGVDDLDDPCPDDPSDDLDRAGRCPSAPAADLLLPEPRAVLQRHDGTCTVTVAGTLRETGFDAAALELWDESGWVDRGDRVELCLDGSFTSSLELPAGLVSHELRVRAYQGAAVSAVVSRQDLVCGDLLLVQGQSNAVAGDYHGEGRANAWQSRWIRSFGSTDPTGADRDLTWGDADGESMDAHAAVGAWALRMAAQLVDDHQLPVGLLNGAVGGTEIGLHQRNDADPEDLDTIYGRFLFRARRSGMAAEAPALFWYQGESDGGDTSQAAPGAYLERFAALREAWHEDFPALERIYVFQVRDGCGVDPSRDGALEVTFEDAAGAVLEAREVPVWPGGSWTSSHLHATAPSGARTATVAIRADGEGALRFDDVWWTDGTGSSFLENGGFESSDPFPLAGWTSSGSGDTRWDEGDAHGGTHTARLHGGSGEQRLSQTLPVVPGQRVELGAWTRAERVEPDVREVQRALPDTFGDVVLMSTTAAPTHDGCHYQTEGYEAIGLAISRLVARDLYGSDAVDDIVPPTVLRARRTAPDEVLLTLRPAGGSLVLEAGFEENFVLAGTEVVGAVVEDGALRLRLGEPTDATELSYLGHAGDGPDVETGLGVGLLSFFGLPIEP